MRGYSTFLKSAILALPLILNDKVAPAADLPGRPSGPTVTAVVYNWTGFYIGGNSGFGASQDCWGFLSTTGIIPDGCHTASGAVVGGQLGFRQQAGEFVFGVELQGDWTTLRGSYISAINPSSIDRSNVDGLLIIAGQLGYAWNAALVYLKGGVAVTESRFDVLTAPRGVGVAGATATRWGPTVGAGLEYGFAPNWSAGVEYNHIFVSNSNNFFSTPSGLAAGVYRIGNDIDLFTVRVNYRIGGWL